uniref:Uncharacterized protein n=1 Tax=Mesocestoides corti TaxID=53468 RepID=A0A5K3F669_MESCO
MGDSGNVDCPNPSNCKVATTDKALLTNHKAGPQGRCRPPESTTLTTPLNICCTPFMSYIHLPRMPLERRETQGWLRPASSNMSAPSDIATSHTSGAFHPSPPLWQHCSLYTALHSSLSLVGCLSSSHVIGTQRDRELAEAIVVQYVCAPRRRHNLLYVFTV